LFKALRVLWQLRPDINALHEDGLQSAPVSLELSPDPENRIDCPQVQVPLIHQFLAELDAPALRRDGQHLK
jgi:hypothetical protein